MAEPQKYAIEEAKIGLSVKARHSHMYISHIKDDQGTWLDNRTDINAQALHFFEGLLSDSGHEPDETAIQHILQHVPSLVSAEDNQHLLRPIIISEVKEAVFSLDRDSAPDGDGFTGHCWEIVADDLLLAVRCKDWSIS